MSREPDDPRGRVDARVDTQGREGLTGTAPAELYVPIAGREQITIPPDFRAPEVQPAWRQDFPIDWPQDQYVERRDFMKFLVLTSAAMTAGQLWIATENWFRRRQGATEIRRIASVDDVPVGGVLAFNYPGDHDPCVLVRVGDSELVAYDQKCTHLSCAVIPRPELGDIRCPCHEGLFDLRTGRPTAGPPQRPLNRITLSVRGRDIFATGIERSTT